MTSNRIIASVGQSLPPICWDWEFKPSVSIFLNKYALPSRWLRHHLLFVCLGREMRNPLLGSFHIRLIIILDNDSVVCWCHLWHDSDHLSLSDDTASFWTAHVRDRLSAHGLIFDNLRLDWHFAAGQYLGSAFITVEPLAILFGQCYRNLIVEFIYMVIENDVLPVVRYNLTWCKFL